MSSTSSPASAGSCPPVPRSFGSKVRRHRVDRKVVTAALRSGLERTLDEDLGYGFRMLVDMAERSLSESAFMDPTTAVQCIDRLHDGLRQLATRRLFDGRLRDEAGELRVVIPVLDWDAYVHLAFDEIRLACTGSPQVTRRLSEAVEDLLAVAPPDRQPVLREQLELLHEAVNSLQRAPADIAFALRPDRQGIGVAASDGQPCREIGTSSAPASAVEPHVGRGVSTASVSAD